MYDEASDPDAADGVAFAAVARDQDGEEHLRMQLIEAQVALEASRAQVESLKAQLDMMQQALMEDSDDAALKQRETASRERGAQGLLLGAVQRGDLELVDQMLRSAAPLGGALLNEALCVASHGGHADVAERLLRAGADVRHDCDSALLWACNGGSAAVVQLLLARGADADALRSCPLRIAARRCATDVVQALLDHGARID